MQQELSVKAAAASVAPSAALGAAAPSSSNASSSSNSRGREQRSPQPAKSDGRAPPQQPHQQHGVRPAVRYASALTSSSSNCCNNRNSSTSSRGHLLLGGWRGFFRGNLTNCLKVVPETAVKFYSYDICKHALAHRKQQQQQQQQKQQPHQQQPAEPAEPHLQLLDRFLCGATAGLCAQLLIYPMELVSIPASTLNPFILQRPQEGLSVAGSVFKACDL